MLRRILKNRILFTSAECCSRNRLKSSCWVKYFSSSVDVAANALLENPVDDVYLKTLYKENIDELPQAIEKMKNYTKLDFINQSSLVYLKVNLNAEGRKKTKKVNVFTTFTLPHNFDHQNKVVVITTDPDIIEEAEKNGAHAAGSTRVFIALMTGKISCDAFVCTEEAEKQLATHVDMNRKFGRLLPNKQRKDITNDFLPLLKKYSTETLIHNAFNYDESRIIVGRVNQDDKELVNNITTAIQNVSNVNTKKQFVIGASISCMTEYIPFQYLNFTAT